MSGTTISAATLRKLADAIDGMGRRGSVVHGEMNAACGMPGSRIQPPRACWFEGLDVAEPMRTIAVAVTAGGDEQ